jgi:hypothetical protein
MSVEPHAALSSALKTWCGSQVRLMRTSHVDLWRGGWILGSIEGSVCMMSQDILFLVLTDGTCANDQPFLSFGIFWLVLKLCKVLVELINSFAKYPVGSWGSHVCLNLKHFIKLWNLCWSFLQRFICSWGSLRCLKLKPFLEAMLHTELGLM